MITNSEARAAALISLETVLKTAGMADGKSLTVQQLQAAKRPLYWHSAVTKDAGKAKPLYAVYDVVDSAEELAADNKTISRAVLIALRVWSTGGFDNKDFRALLGRIENSLIAEDWAVAFDTEYTVNDRFNQPLTAVKIFI